MMIKINNETKKTIIWIMIIKNLMQKLKTIEKKKKHIIDQTFVQRRFEIACTLRENERKNETR
jgi:hypothetical protein